MPSGKGNMVVAQIVVENVTELSLDELCTICHVSPDFIAKLIEYGTLEPVGFSYENWRFNGNHLRIIHTAKRLHEDLEINHAGIALAIDLMHEIEDMRKRLEILERWSLSS